MQLRSKYYTYPVMVENGEYYSNNTFTSILEQKLEGHNVKIILKVELNDKVLLNMIESGQLCYVHHIECPQTCYRRAIKTKSKVNELLIKDSEINGLLQVCSFVVAIQDITKYTNNSLAPDYRGWKYSIEKGCIVAIGNQYNLMIEKQHDDFANTSSIFSIVKNIDPTVDTMGIDIEHDKIIITLPELVYNQYANIQGYITTQQIMHSMIIVPALIYVFAELRRAKNELYMYDGKRWFRSLKKACAKLNIVLDENSLDNMDIVKVSQQLLNSPIGKAVSSCVYSGGVYEN